MELGTLIASLERAADPADALVWLDDLALFTVVEAIGACYDETPTAYVAGAARRFASLASDEDWLAVTAALERADDPASAALVAMVRWAIARDQVELAGTVAGSCSCGAPHGDHPEAMR